ncbi:hypothetical protein Ccrd_023528 [Cynara cardunculus var. scolymus]|uniref:Uncharacterized protein n=1 Tax=Cynara cardunculus var. scolymus TaxID=59895 RepID=A0A103XWL3_CYNCS|nr:hypothetical protein Ccrd_023528 [Cynara cardunculus var. scolymus]
MIRAQNGDSVCNSGVGGVCMMSCKWRDEQHPSFINFISCFLSANSFRLNFVPIAPDFIFNCGGLSLAFIFVINYDCDNPGPIFSRAEKLKSQFAHLYVVITLPTKEQNDSFVHSYFRYGMDIGRPTFIPALDLEMGFEKIRYLVVIRFLFSLRRRGRSKGWMCFSEWSPLSPLIQTIGSIEAIAKASKENILNNTDVSSEKAEMISKFFRDCKVYLSPRIS